MNCASASRARSVVSSDDMAMIGDSGSSGTQLASVLYARCSLALLNDIYLRPAWCRVLQARSSMSDRDFFVPMYRTGVCFLVA